ncbi:hypothetical protein [Pseudomonas brassicacearum]|uniref:hypothetical protein n=1 Tax=Pseudomonas TaxID=286 RepID=UPI001BDDFA17|nr:hypothetical protein [Pseudomonas brassicacearum]
MKRWGIQKSDGQQLLSVGIDAAQFSISWFRPDAPGKTKEGKKGPLTFQDSSKADALLQALTTLIPSEFKDAVVADIARPAASN